MYIKSSACFHKRMIFVILFFVLRPDVSYLAGIVFVCVFIVVLLFK